MQSPHPRPLAAACGAVLLVAGAADAQQVINVPPDPAPQDIGAGTTLNVFDGGQVGGLEAGGDSETNVFDGGVLFGNTIEPTVSRFTSFSDSATLNVNAGGLVRGLFATDDAVVNVAEGGELGDQSRNQGTTFRGNATLNVDGGNVSADGSAFGIDFGGSVTVNLNAGRIADDGILIADDVRLRQTGGFLGGNAEIRDNAVVDILGGRAFERASGRVDGGRVVDGGILNIRGGEVGIAEALPGGTINITGGRVQRAGALFDGGGQINIDGGRVDNFDPTGFEGGTVGRITGGVIDSIFNQGTIEITGGQIGGVSNEFRIDVTGGTIGFFSSNESGADTLVSGGQFEGRIQIEEDGVFTLVGSDFTLDGEPIDLAALGATLDDPFVVEDRGGALLEGTLADGSFFDLVLTGGDSSAGVSGDFVDDSATVQLALSAAVIPSPTAAVGGAMLCGLMALRRGRA